MSQMGCEMFRYSLASFTNSNRKCSLYVVLEVLFCYVETWFCTSELSGAAPTKMVLLSARVIWPVVLDAHQHVKSVSRLGHSGVSI